jgi:hypothetical protein
LIPYSYDTINYNLQQPAPAPPSADNWLGTDRGESFVTLADSVAQLWERLGPVLDQLFPNLARTEGEVYRVLGVKPGDIPNHQADRNRDTE